MSARFDHLVVAVDDLDEAAARWSAAGLSAVRGGAHPVGTENVLVRGPKPAYVELIAAGPGEPNPWVDRVRSARGPISWAIAVDDIEAARTALLTAGFEPGPAVPGSRRTLEGELLEWRVCDVGPGPYDGSVPFLIQWTTPMGAGPADGPVTEAFSCAPPDPDRVADLLLALGFEPSRHWPRRVFEPVDGGVRVTLEPLGDPVDLGSASWSMSWDDEERGPRASLALRTSSGDLTHLTLDGVGIVAWPDRRRLAASVLQPSGGALSALERARAWIEVVVAAGLGTARDVDVAWADGIAIDVVNATRLHGPAGTQPITVVTGVHPLDRDDMVVVGIGDPVEVLERQPELMSGGLAHELDRIDDAFVLALSGGVYVVRQDKKVVTRSLDGSRSNGLFADAEAKAWLAQAEDGSRTDGVVAGAPWL